MRHTMSQSGKLGKKGQFMCDLVKKSEGGGMILLSRGGVHWQGGACFFFREGGSIGMGGPLAWGGGGRMCGLREAEDTWVQCLVQKIATPPRIPCVVSWVRKLYPTPCASLEIFCMWRWNSF